MCMEKLIDDAVIMLKKKFGYMFCIFNTTYGYVKRTETYKINIARRRTIKYSLKMLHIQNISTIDSCRP